MTVTHYSLYFSLPSSPSSPPPLLSFLAHRSSLHIPSQQEWYPNQSLPFLFYDLPPSSSFYRWILWFITRIIVDAINSIGIRIPCKLSSFLSLVSLILRLTMIELTMCSFVLHSQNHKCVYLLNNIAFRYFSWHILQIWVSQSIQSSSFVRHAPARISRLLFRPSLPVTIRGSSEPSITLSSEYPFPLHELIRKLTPLPKTIIRVSWILRANLHSVNEISLALTCCVLVFNEGRFVSLWTPSKVLFSALKTSGCPLVVQLEQ